MPSHFRSLVAGGGTGNATLMLARHYVEFGIQGEIVHVDLSSTSIAIARERLRHSGLLDKVTVRFIEYDLLKLHELDLGTFDYVNCSGVIHHLPDPGAALELLRDHTKPGGSIDLMVYGAIGRTGVYHLQPVMRMLFGTVEPLQERVAMARRLLMLLPPTNWLRKNDGCMPRGSISDDAEIYDMLLHSQDRAYTLPELRQLVERCGLTILTFIEPIIYQLEACIPDRELLSSVRDFDLLDKASITELIAGNIRMHQVLLVRATEPPPPPPIVSPEIVPILIRNVWEKLSALTTIEELTLDQFGLVYRSGPMRSPQLAADIIRHIDSIRTLGEVYRALQLTDGGRYNNLSYQEFVSQFEQVFGFLNNISQMFLRVRL
jgi:ubiquinone/menaquinone biosynthesis C-methylase UbiE